jgi:hypothetical protein
LFSYFLLLCWRLLLKGGKEWLSGLGGCTGSHATAAIAIDASFHFVPCRSASSSRSLIPQHTHTHTRACCALQVLSSSLSVSLVSHLCAVLFIIPHHKTQRNKRLHDDHHRLQPREPIYPLPSSRSNTHYTQQQNNPKQGECLATCSASSLQTTWTRRAGAASGNAKVINA